MKHIKKFNERLTSEERKMNKVFKHQVWLRMKREDQNNLINLRHRLSELRSELKYYKHRGNDVTVPNEKLKECIWKIKMIEKKYYEMYKDMYDVFTNSKLKDTNDKTGIFDINIEE